jgi:hypothetical protein
VDSILLLKSGVLCARGTYGELLNTAVFRSLVGQNELRPVPIKSPSSKHRLSPNHDPRSPSNVTPLTSVSERSSDEFVLLNWHGRGTAEEANNGKSPPMRSGSISGGISNDLRSVILTSPDPNTDQNANDFRAESVYGAAESEERDEIDMIAAGKIDSSVYSAYLAAVGWPLCVFILLSTFFMQASSSLYAFWLAYWVNDDENRISHVEFVLVSAAIVGGNILFACLRSVLFAWGGLRAARKMYEQLTASVFHTTLYFFETTSFGKIINRFAKVIYETDV